MPNQRCQSSGTKKTSIWPMLVQKVPIISRGSVAICLNVAGSLIMTLLKIFCRVYIERKYFENWSVFEEVTDKSTVAP